MTFYYIDTSIWLDYYEKRGKNGEHALNLIKKIIKDDAVLLFSDLHIREFKGLGYNFDEVNSILKIAKPDNLRRVHISREQMDKAFRLSLLKLIPKRDALHAILARDNDAIMVATDKHFEQLSHVVNSEKPEDLLKRSI